MRQLLAEAQLPAHYINGYLPQLCAWVERGEGGEQQALAAAQAKHDQEQAKEQARQQRRARMETLLAAVQLPGHYVTAISAVAGYVASGRGNEAAALDAARAAHPGLARKERMLALLKAQQLPAEAMQEAAGVRDFVSSGTGSEESAMEAARAWHQGKPARDARRERIEQLIAEERLAYICITVEQVQRFIKDGQGTEEEAMAAARRKHEDLRSWGEGSDSEGGW
jgi:hypothetical protein